MADPKFFRRFPRLPISIPARVILKVKPTEAIEAEITNISEGGAFVHCTAQVIIGQEISLEIRFGESKLVSGKIIEMEDDLEGGSPGQKLQKSIVKWARGSSASGFGVEFVNLESDHKKFVFRLVHYFEQLRKAGVDFD